MSIDPDIYSYEALNGRDVVTQILARKNGVKAGTQDELFLDFSREQLSGINLSRAPLHFPVPEESPLPAEKGYEEGYYAAHHDEDAPGDPALGEAYDEEFTSYDDYDSDPAAARDDTAGNNIYEWWRETFAQAENGEKPSCQTSFEEAQLGFGKLIGAQSAYVNYGRAQLSFANATGMDARYCNFLEAETTGLILDQADIADSLFTVDIGLLLASFKDVRNFDKAHFLIKLDDQYYRVTDLDLDEQGHLCAAPESGAKPGFNKAASQVTFATLLPGLEKQIKALGADEIVARLSAAQQDALKGTQPGSAGRYMLGELIEQFQSRKQRAQSSVKMPGPR